MVQTNDGQVCPLSVLAGFGPVILAGFFAADSTLIPDTAKEENYYSLINGKKAFLYLLSDFGIDPIVYPDKEKLLEAGLIHPLYETRISDLQFINYFRFSEFQSIESRTDTFIDALKGNQRFFSRQVKLENPIGINYSKRIENIMPFMGIPSSYHTQCLSARKEIAPEKDAIDIEELTPYIDTDDIYQYQIRLYYENPIDQYLDLFSVFEFINNELGIPFEFMVKAD